MKRLKELYRLLLEKKYTTLSGSMAFFVLINGGATLFLIFIISSSLNVNLNILFVNQDYLPEEVKSILEYILNSSQIFSTSYSIIFLFTSIWGASNLFYQLIQTGEIIFSIEVKASGIVRRTLALIIMVLFIILLIVSIFIMVFAEYLVVRTHFYLIRYIWSSLAFLFLPFVLLTFINLYIPPVRIKMRGAFIGALFTTLFWYIASTIFGFYLKYFSNLKEIYGALALVLCFMLWIYLLTNGLIIGFVINFKIQKMISKDFDNEGNILLG